LGLGNGGEKGQLRFDHWISCPLLSFSSNLQNSMAMA